MDNEDAITQQVNARISEALPGLIAQITAGLNQERNNERERNNQGCNYKNFMACKPKEFKGTEGATGLSHWIESMESVLRISKCAEERKVEFASCMLHGRALTWWNNQIHLKGQETVYSLTWEEFKKLIITEYCPKEVLRQLKDELWHHAMVGTDIDSYTARFHELANLVPELVTPEDKRIEHYIWGLSPEIRGMVTSNEPQTMQATVSLATRLTYDWIRNGGVSLVVQEDPKGKRKVEDSSRNRGNRFDNKKVSE